MAKILNSLGGKPFSMDKNFYLFFTTDKELMEKLLKIKEK